MASYALKRLLGLIPLILVVSVVCFSLMHLIPGGPTGTLAENPKVSAEDVARIRANFGLDRPLPVQYAMWLGRLVLHGDLGRSYSTGEPVLNMIGKRLPATLALMGSAFLIALLVGVSVGIISAIRKNTRVDSFITVTALVVLSIPVFWLGLMSMMLFSVKWALLPSGGMSTIDMPFSLVDRLKHLILPSVVLSVVFVASWSRYVRASLVEVLTQPYISAGHAKGLSPSIIVLKHALRNAAAPVLTVVALHLAMLFTGSVIVETLFAWPGMGRLFVEGLARSDYPRLMGIVFLSSVLIAVLNLVADLLYGFLDPRIRYAR